MKIININKQVRLTRKTFIIICLMFVILFILSLIGFVLSLSNLNKINNNYQVISSYYNELEQKFDSNNANENTNRINAIELEQKKINVDYDNLNTRSARNQQDITFLQTIVNDKNLDSRLDNLEKTLMSNESELDAIKQIQKSQQIALEENSRANEQFKDQIVQKITMMLTNNRSIQIQEKTNKVVANNNVNKAANFQYQLSAIEFRSGELWAVFSPKNIKTLSELRFLSVGDMLDNWKVVHIDNDSVKLTNNNQTYRATIEK